ncbi:MAG: type I-D CRISPR-associated endonuclease Cas1d [Anaerolineae bacterium]
MATLYLTKQRALVKKDGDTLVVHIPADEEAGTPKRKQRIPLMKIDQVVVQGDATITSPALRALLEQRVDVCFLTYHGRFVGRLTPAYSKNSLIRIEQHRAHNDIVRRSKLAARFVAGKLSNMRTLLLRYNRKLNDRAIANAADSIHGVVNQVQALQNNSVDEVEDRMGTLLGLEGAGTAFYFGVFDRLVQGDVAFNGRSKRPPTDPVNALLSYAYTLLMHQVSSAISLVGFEPYVGFLHTSQYGRPALALDLMEEFRPLIADSVALTLINNSMLKAKDFNEELGAYRLTDRGRRIFLTKFEDRMQTTIRHPVFKYKATYKKCLELQVRLLAKYLTGEIPEYVPFLVR